MSCDYKAFQTKDIIFKQFTDSPIIKNKQVNTSQLLKNLNEQNRKFAVTPNKNAKFFTISNQTKELEAKRSIGHLKPLQILQDQVSYSNRLKMKKNSYKHQSNDYSEQLTTKFQIAPLSNLNAYQVPIMQEPHQKFIQQKITSVKLASLSQEMYLKLKAPPLIAIKAKYSKDLINFFQDENIFHQQKNLNSSIHSDEPHITFYKSKRKQQSNESIQQVQQQVQKVIKQYSEDSQMLGGILRTQQSKEKLLQLNHNHYTSDQEFPIKFKTDELTNGDEETTERRINENIVSKITIKNLSNRMKKQSLLMPQDKLIKLISYREKQQQDQMKLQPQTSNAPLQPLLKNWIQKNNS